MHFLSIMFIKRDYLFVSLTCDIDIFLRRSSKTFKKLSIKNM